MQRLYHFCGTAVAHDFGDNGGPGTAVHIFSDPLTDDALELCPRCGLPLADEYRAGRLHVELAALALKKPQPAADPQMRKARAWVKRAKKQKRARAAA